MTHLQRTRTQHEHPAIALAAGAHVAAREAAHTRYRTRAHRRAADRHAISGTVQVVLRQLATLTDDQRRLVAPTGGTGMA